jgi:hypothetical protein
MENTPYMIDDTIIKIGKLKTIVPISNVPKRNRHKHKFTLRYNLLKNKHIKQQYRNQVLW